jgi:uncharacterized membrane protein
MILKYSKTLAIGKVFLIIGTITGLIWCFLVPPFQAPDEITHFVRSYMISEGRFVGVNDKDKKLLGYYIPKSIRHLTYDLESHQIPFHVDHKQNLHFLKNASKIKLNADETVFSDFYNTCVTSPLPYIPQAIGIFILN